MTMGIQPESVDAMSIFEMEIYSKLIPLYTEYQNINMENTIKKALSEMMS
jgi:hypothetical protein